MPTPPAIPAVPAGVHLQPVWRRSVIYGAATVVDGQAHGWVPDDEVVEQWAKFIQVGIQGVDYTFPRDTPTVVLGWDLEVPGSYGTAVIRFPRFTIFDSIDDDLNLAFGPPVTFWKILPDGSRGRILFNGHIVSPTESDGGQGRTFECRGVFASLAERSDTPELNEVDARDLGDVIGDYLDNTVARPFGLTERITIGVQDRSRGSQGQSRYDRVASLIAKTTSNNGLICATIIMDGDQPKIVEVDLSADPDYTFRAGQPGIVFRVNKDTTGAPTVIWGTGTAPDGCRWYNLRAPRRYDDDETAFPGPDLDVGTVDADTASGTGVSDFQDRMRRLGYAYDASDVDGSYTADDADEVRDFQQTYGLTVTGVVDSTTWDAIFAAGVDDDDENVVVRRPLAFSPLTEPYLWDGHGRILADNPDYDDTVARVEIDIDFGENITKRKANRLARAWRLRDWPAKWVGEIVWNADPNQCHRRDIQAGKIVQAEGYHDAATEFYISGAQIDNITGEVVTPVAAQAVDLMAFNAIRDRNREARQNPSRKFFAGLVHQSRVRKDSLVPWLCEDGAGIYPKGTQLLGGQWNKTRILGSSYGRIAEVIFATVSPATSFAMMVFGKKPNLTDIATWVPGPLTVPKPYAAHMDDLRAAGMVMCWGSSEQPCGYSPGLFSDGDTLTGRLLDTTGFEFASAKDPWLWVLVYPTDDTTASGYFKRAAET